MKLKELQGIVAEPVMLSYWTKETLNRRDGLTFIEPAVLSDLIKAFGECEVEAIGSRMLFKEVPPYWSTAEMHSIVHISIEMD